MPLATLEPGDYGFPDPTRTPLDDDGLLAVGGDLQPARLLAAYANGIFPWFNSDQENILWWCPDPRGVLRPKDFSPKRSLRKILKNKDFEYRFDTDFDAVISACAEAPRANQRGTWITNNMQIAYSTLHKLGFAHSVEVWQQGTLVGGLYGVSLGQMFFGESMFSQVSNASKCAFAVLCDQLSTWNFKLLDCQMMNPHLESLGVQEMARDEFLRSLQTNDLSTTRRGLWRQITQ